jgi:hypothetical protein
MACQLASTELAPSAEDDGRRYGPPRWSATPSGSCSYGGSGSGNEARLIGAARPPGFVTRSRMRATNARALRPANAHWPDNYRQKGNHGRPEARCELAVLDGGLTRGSHLDWACKRQALVTAVFAGLGRHRLQPAGGTRARPARERCNGAPDRSEACHTDRLEDPPSWPEFGLGASCVGLDMARSVSARRSEDRQGVRLPRLGACQCSLTVPHSSRRDLPGRCPSQFMVLETRRHQGP